MTGVRVYVGGIPKSAVNRDIEQAFQRFGTIVNVWIARNPPGFAFVDFEDPRDADDAIQDMDGKELMGERIKVQLARGSKSGGTREREYGGRRERYDSYDRRDYRPTYKVRITGLPPSTDWRDVKEFVRKEAFVEYCDMDGDDAVVEFNSKYDVDNVIRKLDDTDFDGHRIRIHEDNPRHRSPSPRRYRSPSRSPRRSPQSPRHD